VRADELEWQRLENGAALGAAEQAGFDLLLACDQNVPYPQNLTTRKPGPPGPVLESLADPTANRGTHRRKPGRSQSWMSRGCSRPHGPTYTHRGLRPLNSEDSMRLPSMIAWWLPEAPIRRDPAWRRIRIAWSEESLGVPRSPNVEKLGIFQQIDVS
jgi:hypothetical protein